jgi:3-hydroxymyristoyl/3-hydroxydecanoyl-(acyl carrier protein) dehydratase
MEPPPPFDQARIRELLPHRGAALLLERVVEVVPGKRAVGLKTIRAGDRFLDGHFPGQPVMPGAAIVECMAQLAGVLTALTIPKTVSRGGLALLGIDRTRFRRPVFPDETLRIEITVLQRRDPVWKFHGIAWVGEEKAAEGTLKAGLLSDKGAWSLSSERSWRKEEE